MNKIFIPKGKQIKRDKTFPVAARLDKDTHEKICALTENSFLTQSQILGEIIKAAIDSVIVVDADVYFKIKGIT